MNVVIDANTLVAGAIRKEPPSIINKIVDAWRYNKAYNLVISEHTLSEVKNTFKDKYFVDRLNNNDIGNYIARLRKKSTLVTIQTHVRGIAAHIQDDEVISTAISGKAQFIVTRDTDFLAVKSYQSIQIIDPYQFFHIIRRNL